MLSTLCISESILKDEDSEMFKGKRPALDSVECLLKLESVL